MTHWCGVALGSLLPCYCAPLAANLGAVKRERRRCEANNPFSDSQCHLLKHSAKTLPGPVKKLFPSYIPKLTARSSLGTRFRSIVGLDSSPPWGEHTLFLFLFSNFLRLLFADLFYFLFLKKREVFGVQYQ